MAETRNPARGISRGSVHDGPTGKAGRARKTPYAHVCETVRKSTESSHS